MDSVGALIAINLSYLQQLGGEITNRDHNEPAPHKEARDLISAIEAEMREMPGAMLGDCWPLKHSFAEGLYIREFHGPAKLLVVSKIHKQSSASFLLKGKISIWGTDGVETITAPASWVTPAGTKRVVYFHEDTVLTGVYATTETDVVKIEEQVIAKDFNELDNVVEINEIMEAINNENIQ